MAGLKKADERMSDAQQWPQARPKRQSRCRAEQTCELRSVATRADRRGAAPRKTK